MDFEWFKPWKPVTDEQLAKRIEDKLKKDLPEGHVLYGREFKLIATNGGASDDYLFQLADGGFAEVELIWSSQDLPLNLAPPFPATTIYASLDQWAEDTGWRWEGF